MTARPLIVTVAIPIIQSTVSQAMHSDGENFLDRPSNNVSFRLSNELSAILFINL